MTQTALILGPTGRFGRTVMDAFQAAGWATRAFSRGDDLTGAARGVDIIVNGWNPAYPDWKDQVPQLTDQVIRAALRIWGYGYHPRKCLSVRGGCARDIRVGHPARRDQPSGPYQG